MTARIVLVTGAGRGIGLEVARQLGEAKHIALLGTRDSESGRTAVRELGEAGRSAVPLVIDVTCRASVEAAIGRIGSELGRLDGLVNNAGIFRSDDLAAFPSDAVTDMIETNFLGAWRTTAACLDLLRRSPTPCVVNVSSATASLQDTSIGAPIPGDATRRTGYCCTKAALNMLTLQYRASFERSPELRHIRINSASPGYTATAMNDFQGERSAADAARIVVGLATLGADGPTGRFLSDSGDLPW